MTGILVVFQLLFLLFHTCFSQAIDVLDFPQPSPNVIDTLREVSQDIEKEIFDEHSSSRLIKYFNNQCLKGIFIPPPVGLDNLLTQTDGIFYIDSLLTASFQLLRNNHLMLSYHELLFRTLVQVQFRLEELFLALPSQEKISYMVRYILLNKNISELKTSHLHQTILLYSQLKTTSEKRRYWESIDRLLMDTDLKMSETGNQLVQRSPYGIITHPREILAPLKWQCTNETEQVLRESAGNVIENIETAERKYNRATKYNIYIQMPKGNMLNEINIQAAADYFEKAFEEEDNALKIDFYSRSIEANPNFSPAYYNRGIAYYEEKKYSEAIQDFDQALKLEAKSAMAYYYRGVCYQELNELEKAIVSYSCAITLDPEPEDGLMNRGLCYQKLGNFPRAINDYTRIIKRNPQNVPALTNRGYCYQQIKDFPRATRDYKKVIEIAPFSTSAYYNLGSIYWIQQEWDAVIEVWEKCLEINPNHEQILDNLPTAKVNARFTKKQKKTVIIDQDKILE
jgi:tetratricopeptide (TPR) repeat protein